jgi:hypothetical protein
MQLDNREASMTLSIKLHTLDVTLSSMTLRVLSVVQLRNWVLFGSSLKRSLQRLSWRINCMQFGKVLLYPFTVSSDWLPVGTVYPWTALVPFNLQNLNSSIEGQAKVSPNEFIYHLIGFGEIVFKLLHPFHWPTCHKIY